LAYQLVQAQTECVPTRFAKSRTSAKSPTPKVIPKHQSISAAVYYHPLNRIGGDLLDIFQLEKIVIVYTLQILLDMESLSVVTHLS
jgi:hypothetical protein